MKSKTLIMFAGLLFVSFAPALLLDGCSTASPTSSAASAPVGAGGAKLWADNCMHCHNMRSPASYSDAQWEVVALHMRVRANLTAHEHQEIIAFLKSAH